MREVKIKIQEDANFFDAEEKSEMKNRKSFFD